MSSQLTQHTNPNPNKTTKLMSKRNKFKNPFPYQIFIANIRYFTLQITFFHSDAPRGVCGGVERSAGVGSWVSMPRPAANNTIRTNLPRKQENRVRANTGPPRATMQTCTGHEEMLQVASLYANCQYEFRFEREYQLYTLRK